MSVRLRVAASALALATLAGGRRGAAQAGFQSVVARSYETVKVADGIYAFVSPEGYGAWVSGNSLVVIGDSGVLVVDSGHFPNLTRRVIADIRKLTNQPVRYLVNTHWHPDHWMGNSEYRAAFPNVTIVSTPVARAEIESRGPQFLAEHHDSAGSLARFQGILKKGMSLWRPGAPLNDDERSKLMMSIADGQSAAAGWRLATLAPPTLTFDQSLPVNLGNRDVRVKFLGRGNTAGDAVVYVPDRKVLATGDLVVAPVPYAYGSFIGEWIDTMRKLEAIDATTIVPGHGPIQHDMRYVSLVTDALVALRAATADAVKRGLSLDSTRKVVRLERFEKRFEGSDPRRRELFLIHFLDSGVPRAYAEARYERGQ